MELNSTSIHDVIHPTSAFLRDPPQIPTPSADNLSWAESQLNPKNRIDSLEPPRDPLWKIDGCTGLGTQYYVVPLFLKDVPPVRIDVFIPEEVATDASLRELLDLNIAFHTKDAPRLRRLGIASHILRTLQVWTLSDGSNSREAIADMYKKLPFGSRIIFENLNRDVTKIKVTIAPTYYVETQLLSHSKLASALGLSKEALPEAIDIARLSFVEQLHDSVCLVRMNPNENGDTTRPHIQEDSSKLWVMKALTSGTKYLFGELRTLLQLEPHPHVISRPEYLVTKYCRFGGKTAVAGFIIRYHAAGSLRDTLPLLRIHGRLTISAQLKWATQLTSGVLHVRERGRTFYPDLRLDNMVLSDAGHVIMIDFEQRGVWCEFSAPEVNALEYIRLLAGANDLEDDYEANIQEGVRDHFAELLNKLLPGWELLQSIEEYGELPHGYTSYNIPWQCLSPAEQEAAEVYMLGRVLWCIFEGQSAPQHSAVWQSYRWEPDYEFPEFRRTPPELRDLIDHCTSGRRGVLSRIVTRRGSKLVLRSTRVDTAHDAHQVFKAAQDWWAAEIKFSEEFVQMRTEMKQRGEWDENYYNRPTLKEVLTSLERFQASIGSGT